MHEAGGADKELIAFSYSRNEDWVKRLFPMLPKDITLQVDFSKGGVVERDGIRHQTGDYNLTLIGPPEQFVEHHELALKLGLRFITKTEHAVSQELSSRHIFLSWTNGSGASRRFASFARMAGSATGATSVTWLRSRHSLLRE